MKPALTIVMIALAGCGEMSDRIAGVYGDPAPAIRYQELVQARAPGLQLGVEKTGAAGVVFLDVSRDGVMSFLSVDGLRISTRGGVIVATRGLPSDIMSSDVSDSLALILAGRTGRAERFHSFLTGENKTELRSYICDITNMGTASVDLTTGPTPALIMGENCASADQSFVNYYWIDRDGREILQSQQWGGDETGPLALRVFR